MWGDPERAVRLDGSDSLVSVLFQVTGPAHVPWQDPVWQELLHGYNVWVHATADFVAVARAAELTVQHSHRSSNLAALAIHVTRVLTDFSQTQQRIIHSSSNNDSISSTHFHHHQRQSNTNDDQVTAFSNRISLVGKARAAAGAMNLLRILAHAVIQQQQQSVIVLPNNDDAGNAFQRHWMHTSSNKNQRQPSQPTTTDRLRDAFLYKSREPSVPPHDTGADLMDAVLQFLCQTQLLSDIPELYDCVTLALELLLVLLSTQLYQPMISSFQKQHSKATSDNNSYTFWKFLMEHAAASETSSLWTPRQLLTVLLEYQIHRPIAPDKCIQYHSCILTQQVVSAKGEKMSHDGMYESYMVVNACATAATSLNNSTTDNTAASAPSASLVRRPSNSAILDATRGVLVISSQIILLPIRLMTMALELWGLHHHHRGMKGGYDQAYKQHLQDHSGNNPKTGSRTRDVLWLTMSPVADLSTTVLLLLIHNERAESKQQRSSDARKTGNPFRAELAGLTDNRWESDGSDLPDLPESTTQLLANGHDDDDSSLRLEEANPLILGASSSSSFVRPTPQRRPSTATNLTANFEALFESFGWTAHTEPGALMLYTLLQSSSAFAQSIAVRSDLDTLVLPLLRTLYFATSLRFHVQHDYSSSNGGSRASLATGNGRRRSSVDSYASFSTTTTATTITMAPLSIRDCPYRSQSQLYVIVILLLLFSQDPSFGADAFRRVMIPTVPWYKERYLKEISLGSVLLLSVLRSLTFNLNRQHDAFLLSNCCAVLMNLSPSIVDLHDYAAMRLASFTVSSIKRYLVLRRENPDNDDDDLTTPTSMHGEASRTLLCLLKHCLSAKNIDKNLHLIYALVYHQADFKRIFSSKGCPFKKSEISRIQTVIAAAASLIEQDGSARTAAKALKILSDKIDVIHDAVADRRKRAEPEDFTFAYEEEADPEIFFVPYLWEVIVCVVTSASIEWNKNRIQVFPLLEDVDDGEDFDDSDTPETDIIPQFARDVSDIV